MRGHGSMGVSSELAVSIPQIIIDDSVEKKDVSFFAEEPSSTAEGTACHLLGYRGLRPHFNGGETLCAVHGGEKKPNNNICRLIDFKSMMCSGITT